MYICGIYVHTCGQQMYHTAHVKSSTCGTWFSPSTIKLMSPGLVPSCLYPQRHLTSPEDTESEWTHSGIHSEVGGVGGRKILEPFLTKASQRTNFAQMIKFIDAKRTQAMGVSEVWVHTEVLTLYSALGSLLAAARHVGVILCLWLLPLPQTAGKDCGHKPGSFCLRRSLAKF